MPQFKTEQGLYITKALFREEARPPYEHVLYCLSDQDHHSGAPSLYRLYMEMADLTEFEFSNTYFAGWEHWEEVQKCKWFQPYIARWRQELLLSLENQILKRLKTWSTGEVPVEREVFQANKMLLDRIRKRPETHRRGRPSKTEVENERKRQVEAQFALTEDAKRILRPNDGA